MGWLDDITSEPWQKIWEKIQKTVEEWTNPKMVSPVPDEVLKDTAERAMQQPVQQVQAQQPTPAPFMYDYLPYIADQEAVDRKYPNGIPQLEGESSDLVRQYLPNDATAAAIAILTESGNNPNAQGTNRDGSTDRGLGQINSNTFADYFRRMPKVMEGMGINSYQDMYDPEKNIKMMDLIRKYQGWGAWYGPGNAGFDLNK